MRQAMSIWVSRCVASSAAAICTRYEYSTWPLSARRKLPVAMLLISTEANPYAPASAMPSTWSGTYSAGSARFKTKPRRASGLALRPFSTVPTNRRALMWASHALACFTVNSTRK